MAECKAVLYKIVWRQRTKEKCECCKSGDIDPRHGWKDMEEELVLGTTLKVAQKNADRKWDLADNGYEISGVDVLSAPVGTWLDTSGNPR